MKSGSEKISQVDAFMAGEADSWFNRNPESTLVAGTGDPVMDALARVDMPDTGALLDVGGSAGRLAAGFVHRHPAWRGVVLEPSGAAIAAGTEAFPHLHFQQGTIFDRIPPAEYDLVIISFVLHWLDREALSQAIANTDLALKDRGLLVVSDFDPAVPRANPYVHKPGLCTYKQDYAACYTALATYHTVSRSSFLAGTSADPSDPYDEYCSVTILRKDLYGRYARR